MVCGRVETRFSPQKPIDQVSEKLLEGRTQYGNIKAPEKTAAEKKEIAATKKEKEEAEKKKWEAAPRRSGREKKQKTKKPEKQVDDGFKKLNARYQKIVRFIKGEQTKSYSGPNEQKLTRKYNAMIREGHLLAKKMRKIKKSWPNSKYVDDFEIP